MDALYWGPNWTSRPSSEFRERLEESLSGPQWVICGNFNRSRDLSRDVILSRATAVICLNYWLPLIFGRALKRTTLRVMTGEQLYSGNRKTLRDTFLSRDSILLWVLTSHRRRSRWSRELFDGPEYPHVRRIEFHQPKDTEAFLRSIRIQRSANVIAN
jgi:hypothetical protein